MAILSTLHWWHLEPAPKYGTKRACPHGVGFTALDLLLLQSVFFLTVPQVKDFEAMKEKAREEELQIAETKMVMHQVSWMQPIN